MKKVLLLGLALFTGIAVYAQNDCELPEITEVTGAGTYCPGEEVTLELTGELNDAAEWTWYADRCGGQSIGTGTTLTVTVEETVSYFVRGTGNCAANNAECVEILVKLDDEGPVVTSGPEDITVDNDPGLCEAVVEFEAPTGEDNCSDEITIEQVEGLESGSSFPVGETVISFDLTDSLGNVTTHTFLITVLDSEPPVIECPEDIEVDNDPGDCGAIVTYDVPVGTDNCEGAVTELSEGLGSGAFFPVGTTIDTYTVTDAAGNTATCSVSITVYDVEPPVITLNNKKNMLWPPNHKHHSVDIMDYIESVSDNCGGVSIEDVVIEMVSSDEANNGKGDGNTLDDIMIMEDCQETLLLSERSGAGNGRVYRINLGLVDLHGNIGRASFTTEVPHDRGKKTETIDDGDVYIVNGCNLEEDEETTDGSNSGRVEVELGTFPNPFNSSFEMEFTPEVEDVVHVEIYNLMGRKVAELFEGRVEPNTRYNWRFDPPTLENDVYILVLWGQKTYGTKRIIYKN